MRAQHLTFITLLLLVGSSARADDGLGYGVGPVFATSLERPFSVGWEASGTVLGPIAKASIGGIYAVGGPPQVVHYLVLEPWLIVGGTLGIAIPGSSKPVLAYGAWEGIPYALEGELGNDPDDEHEDEEEMSWMLTLSFGFRGFGRDTQWYFAPKLWRFYAYDFFT